MASRGEASRACWEVEATRLMVRHILDVLQFHGLLLVSEHCVLLHGASVMGDSGGSTDRPGEEAGAAGTEALATQMAEVEVEEQG